MVSVDDASGSEAELQAQRDKLKSADIDDRDKDAIQRFIRHRKVHGTARSGTYSASSEKTDLSKLRLSSKRAPTPLVDMGMDDINEFLETLQAPKENGGYGIGTGIDGYTRALRVFYRWMHRHDKEDEYPFWEQIKTGNVDFDQPSDREFPDRDDYGAMMQAGRGDPRAQAILAFFWESAARRSLGSQLRLKDLELTGEWATFQPNPNGERQKGVEIKDYPLYDGVAKLRVWVNNHHPDPDNPDAPLFTSEYYDHDNPEDSALSSQRIYEILKELGDDADVSAETKPHAFRHAAVGRWKERGYSLPQVQRRTAWSDRSAAEMWGKYGDPDDDKVDSGIAELEGADVSDAEEQETNEPPERRTCGNCGATGITGDHCDDCGAPVTDEAIQRDLERQKAREKVQAGAEQRAFEVENEAERRVVETVLQQLRENPEELVDGG